MIIKLKKKKILFFKFHLRMELNWMLFLWSGLYWRFIIVYLLIWLNVFCCCCSSPYPLPCPPVQMAMLFVSNHSTHGDILPLLVAVLVSGCWKNFPIINLCFQFGNFQFLHVNFNLKPELIFSWPLIFFQLKPNGAFWNFILFLF